MLLHQLPHRAHGAAGGAGLFVPPLICVADGALSLRERHLYRDTRSGADLHQELAAAGRVYLAARDGIPRGGSCHPVNSSCSASENGMTVVSSGISVYGSPARMTMPARSTKPLCLQPVFLWEGAQVGHRVRNHGRADAHLAVESGEEVHAVDDAITGAQGSRGTCYASTSVDTAVREKVRGRVSRKGVVSRALADSFVVSVVSVPMEHRCAAVNHVDAAMHGIVRELTTMADYAIPQAGRRRSRTLASTASSTGLRSPRGADAYALFGDAGVPAGGAGHSSSPPLSGEDACRALGWTVANTPAAGGMNVI